LVDGIIEQRLTGSDEMAAEAWAAMARQDTDEALRLWQRLRQHYPERPEGHISPIQVLWQAGRLDEAEAMAEAASKRHPDDPELLAQYAWIATKRQRWDEALDRWATVRKRAPRRPDAYVWAARALWQSGRTDDAEAMAAEALRRFPDNADALAEYAWVAVEGRDWDKALQRWSAVAERFPERADARAGTIQALRMLGRAGDAEAEATKALAAFPDNADVFIEYVWAAAARNDWPEAALRLEAARGKLQDPGRFERALGWVEYRLRSQLAPVAAAGPPTPTAEPDQGETPIAELMLAFESLGERCDFGAVQRHFGVEPLGLLRFGFTAYEPLIAALEDRFEAVGTEEDTSFELYAGETILYMRKYGLVFHTFVYEGEDGRKREAFRQQQRRRLSFLRDKLVADLEEPQKICIYATDERVRDADVRRLFGVLRRYGPNSLLYVRPADASHPEGTVEKLEEGLFAGYFARLVDFVAGEQPPFELWRQLCERTQRLASQAAERAIGK
jgi:tetratricopeptide (TPR) repeat protein